MQNENNLFHKFISNNLLFLKAQEPFIHLGAEWTYEEVYYDFTQFPHPKITYSLTNLKYTNDEVINGKLFKLIEGNNETYYIHENDGVIYYLHPGDTINLFKLFDFNVLPKDSFLLRMSLEILSRCKLIPYITNLLKELLQKRIEPFLTGQMIRIHSI